MSSPTLLTRRPVLAARSGRSSNAAGRVFGLDILRAMAIVLVLISHSWLMFVGLLDPTTVVQVTGFLAVELFFVLSGFLIGRILLATVWQAPTWASLKDFWFRRWLRTLPAYYVVLVVILALSATGLLTYRTGWREFSFFVFWQNMFARDVWEGLFGVGWSLVIEEWFYLVTPVLVILARRFGRGRDISILLTLCAGLIIGPLVLRLGLALLTDMDWWTVRKTIAPRFDAIAFGTLVATLSIYRPETIAALQRHGWLCAAGSVLGLAALSVALRSGSAIVESTVMKTIGFSVAPACFALLLPAFLAADHWSAPFPRLARVTSFVSTTSYAVYLVHWDLQQAIRSLDLGVPQYWKASLCIAVSLVIIYVVAAVLHWTVETYFMRLRNRLPKPVRAA